MTNVDFTGTGFTFVGLCFWGFIALASGKVAFDIKIAGMILGAIFIIEIIETLFRMVMVIIKK